MNVLFALCIATLAIIVVASIPAAAWNRKHCVLDWRARIFPMKVNNEVPKMFDLDRLKPTAETDSEIYRDLPPSSEFPNRAGGHHVVMFDSDKLRVEVELTHQCSYWKRRVRPHRLKETCYFTYHPHTFWCGSRVFVTLKNAQKVNNELHDLNIEATLHGSWNRRRYDKYMMTMTKTSRKTSQAACNTTKNWKQWLPVFERFEKFDASGTILKRSKLNTIDCGDGDADEDDYRTIIVGETLVNGVYMHILEIKRNGNAKRHRMGRIFISRHQVRLDELTDEYNDAKKNEKPRGMCVEKVEGELRRLEPHFQGLSDDDDVDPFTGTQTNSTAYGLTSNSLMGTDEALTFDSTASAMKVYIACNDLVNGQGVLDDEERTLQMHVCLMDMSRTNDTAAEFETIATTGVSTITTARDASQSNSIEQYWGGRAVTISMSVVGGVVLIACAAAISKNIMLRRKYNSMQVALVQDQSGHVFENNL